MFMKIKIISTIERPLPRCQSYSCVNSCSMIFPIRRILEPPSIEEIAKVVRAGINTIVIPLKTPGSDNGNVILRKV